MRLYKPVELKVLGASEAPAIRRPEDAIEWVRKFDLFDPQREVFVVVYLNTRHRPITEPYPVSLGSLNASLVHPREVFGPAMELRAAAILVFHNHPSGETMPSGDDLDLTCRLDKGGDLLGIGLLDHIIITEDSHRSIREHGWPR